jgi:hypothetical protein
MPIQHSIWIVGDKPVALAPSSLKDEMTLENMIETDPAILAEEWLIIGRQIHTSHNGYIDLLAIAPDGSLVVIELKRDKTPRDVVSQAIDYASWVETLEAEQIKGIYSNYRPQDDLASAFERRFKQQLLEENLNQSHQIVVVAAELDPSTERIISYLNERSLAINALFFEVFASGTEQFLVRRWLVDPAVAQINAGDARKDKEPWNGEFFVSFGEGATRSWEDARKFGFISAGGGAWYSRTLNMLKAGDRILVRIPGLGYVGVGMVSATAQCAREFSVLVDGEEVNISEVAKGGTYGSGQPEEDEEYFVKVDWLVTTSSNDAYDELGFFGNQNSVCRPTASKWRTTVEKVKAHFQIS